MKKRYFLFVTILLFFMLVALSIALTFDVITSSDFNNGTYLGTRHNGTGVVINQSLLNGTYSSKIFDSGSNFVEWSNLTIYYSVFNGSLLISSDAQSSVWNSSDQGVNWSLIVSDYNGAESNGADDMAVNMTNSIFIMNNQKIWISNDKGQNWVKVNDDFNGAESFGGLAMTINSNNTVFAVDVGEGIWVSYNSGINFTKVNNSFNSGGQNAARMTSNSTSGLFIVDSQSKVWSSSNDGATWTNVNSDFNGAGITNVGADGIRTNSSDAIYIVDRQRLWVSTDNGVNWNNVNSDFNGAVGSNAFSMNIDEKNNIYIIDGNEDVYFSNDQGVTFNNIASNINGGNGGIKSVYSIFSSSNVKYQIRNCTLSCTTESYFGPDGTSNTYYFNRTSTFNVSGRYFQYKLSLTRNDLSVNPIVYNTSIGYYLINSAPIISIVSPTSGNYSSVQTMLNYTISDVNLQSCWYSLNSGVTNVSITCGINVTGLSSNQGINVWTVYANDTLGLSSYSNVTFFVDSISPNVSFNGLTLNSGVVLNNQSLSIGVTANDSLLANTTIFLFNSTALIRSNFSNSNSFNITYSNLGDGIYFYNATSIDSFNNRNSTETRNATIDTTSPLVEIFFPSNGSTLGDNTSIIFNYTINEIHLDSCWYSLDGGSNISLPSCANTTFNTSEGNHLLKLYSNDTAGNIGFTSASFSIQVGAPSILLLSPNNVYLNYQKSIFLNYIPTDIDLSTCSLWGNFNGVFAKNITNSTPSSSVQNSFLMEFLGDGLYMWAISCNDTIGNEAISANKTFVVDTTPPNVSNVLPSGTYTSLLNIPLSLSYSDASPVKCFYNVTFSATGNVQVPNSELANCQPTTFSLDVQTSYFLWMMVNDSAGNINITKKSFTISSDGGSSGGSSGGGGGGGRGAFSVVPQFRLKLTDLEKTRISRGGSELIQLVATNNGLRFLNDCYFSPSGGISSWLSGQDIFSLSPGQTVNYVFNINVPINAEIGDYFTSLSVNCKETNATTTYEVEVMGGEFELNILNSERIGSKLSVDYTIENFANKDKNLGVFYKFINSDNLVIVEGSFDDVLIMPNQTLNLNGEFELPKNSIGDYTLVIELTDGLDFTQKEKIVRLTSGSISGFAISERNLKTISWLGLIIILSFAIFAVLKTLKKELAIQSANQHEKDFITIDLKN